MKNHLLLIESNTTGTGRLFVARSRELGFCPLLIVQDPSRYPYIQEDKVDFLQLSSVQDLDVIRRCIDGLALKCNISGIYSSSEYFIETSAQLAREYGLPGPDPFAAKACRNKWEQRKRLQAAGVNIPAFALASSEAEALDAVQTIGLPVVIKPVLGSGSVGVRLCRTAAEAKEHAAALLAVRTNERGMPVVAEILVEQYLSHPEYSVESLEFAVVGITQKYVSAEPFFVETGHDFPATLKPEVAALIMSTVQKSLHAVGLTWGPAHTEVRCDNNTCSIMEINPRLAGGFIPTLVRQATGIDLIRETIRVVVGQAPDIRYKKSGHASIRFICCGSGGKLGGVVGLEEAAAVDGVVEVSMYRQNGTSIVIRHDFRDRIGHVLSTGATARDAVQSAESALQKIEIHIHPELT